MSMKYIKKYNSKTDFNIFFQNENETKLVIDGEQSPKVIKWLSEGNQFEVIPFVPLPLADYKAQKINEFSEMAMTKRQEILPDYKLVNSLFDIYEDNEPGTKAKYKKSIQDFRTEFYRLKSLVESATTNDEIDLITENYPKGI